MNKSLSLITLSMSVAINCMDQNNRPKLPTSQKLLHKVAKQTQAAQSINMSPMRLFSDEDERKYDAQRRITKARSILTDSTAASTSSAINLQSAEQTLFLRDLCPHLFADDNANEAHPSSAASSTAILPLASQFANISVNKNQ